MKSAIEIIQEHGFQVKDFTGTQTDFDGVDCYVYDKEGCMKHVDYKVQTTNSDYNTVLISLMHRKPNTNEWHLPKYLERNDVYVWCICVDTGIIFEISPKMLSEIGKWTAFTLHKKAGTDYLGREHLLAAIKQSDCRIVDDGLYGVFDKGNLE